MRNERATREEHDLLGRMRVPADAYWGIHTLRATQNFPISGHAIAEDSHLIRALASIKLAAAQANAALGALDRARADAIVAACREILDGRLHDQFVVDAVQGGAGTSVNMNANEVIANRALELLGQPRGAYHRLHPNEHVNLGQSTNDVYPTAIRLSSYWWTMALMEAMRTLKNAYAKKAEEFADIVKVGRTQLQDAVPMTLGQEFGAYAAMLADDERLLADAGAQLLVIGLGGTAIGTGISAPPGYAQTVRAALSKATGLPLSTAKDLFQATQDCGAFVHLSSVVKRIAVKQSKICSDLRLLSSGPRCGLGEIALPPRQAGSSLMPGKINPVIPEVVNQIAFEIVGNDVTIAMAAESGQLQLNAFEPIIAHALHRSLRHLRNGLHALATHCVDGIEANRSNIEDGLRRSLAMVTALNPHIGYAAATEVAAEAAASGRPLRDVVLARGLMSEALLDWALCPQASTRPAVADAPADASGTDRHARAAH